MKYIVELKVKVDGTGVKQFNEFTGKYNILKRIRQWIFEVRKEYGYRDMQVEKVIVNNEDFTGNIL